MLAAACVPRDPFPLPSGDPGVQAVSLLGDSLVPVRPSDSIWAAQWAQLDSAHAALVTSPADPSAWIWLGRRLAYLGYYRPAIAAYSEALSRYPGDARLLRHRAHRNITVRNLDAAIADFVAAAKLVQGLPDEIEPDGQPNARGIPTSTLQFNIWYHLGLAHYLKGDFQRALSAYRECLNVSGNPDALVATSHWLYMTLRRLGDDEEAERVLLPITADMDIIENDAYHRLLLMYKGEIAPEDLLPRDADTDAVRNATVAYGVGNWWLYTGDTTRAIDVFQEIVRGSQWAAFGAIAAEAELARSRRRP
jgi:tetratricopeptide (TPR) repeat protein